MLRFMSGLFAVANRINALFTCDGSGFGWCSANELLSSKMSYLNNYDISTLCHLCRVLRLGFRVSSIKEDSSDWFVVV